MATTYKVLGQSAQDADTAIDLYTVPANTQAVISTLVIANRHTQDATYRIAIRPNGATLANQHYIAYDVSVAASDSTTLTLGITLDAADVITVRASSDLLTFSVFGSEITA
jgi:hypothetical protein